MKKLRKISIEGLDLLTEQESASLFGGDNPLKPAKPTTTTPPPKGSGSLEVTGKTDGKGGGSVSTTGTYTNGNKSVGGSVSTDIPSGKTTASIVGRLKI